MKKIELNLKIITKGENIYIFEQNMNKWLFFKYPEIKKDITEQYLNDLKDKKDTIIIVNSDFINIKDTTIFYNSKFINFKKATV